MPEPFETSEFHNAWMRGNRLGLCGSWATRACSEALEAWRAEGCPDPDEFIRLHARKHSEAAAEPGPRHRKGKGE